jgi:hypothetical protein
MGMTRFIIFIFQRPLTNLDNQGNISYYLTTSLLPPPRQCANRLGVSYLFSFFFYFIFFNCINRRPNGCTLTHYFETRCYISFSFFCFFHYQIDVFFFFFCFFSQELYSIYKSLRFLGFVLCTTPHHINMLIV